MFGEKSVYCIFVQKKEDVAMNFQCCNLLFSMLIFFCCFSNRFFCVHVFKSLSFSDEFHYTVFYSTEQCDYTEYTAEIHCFLH